MMSFTTGLIYMSVKVQGTSLALQDCRDWFLRNRHLQGYTRHFEVLVPIWEMKPGRSHPHFTVDRQPGGQGHTFVRAFQGLAITPNLSPDIQEASTAFQLASKNATMDEIFGCAQTLFPGLCALTIEGGHCKHPPKVQYFREEVDKPLVDLGTPFHSFDNEDTFESLILTLSMPAFRSQARRSLRSGISSGPYLKPSPLRRMTPAPELPILPNTKTLILKGAWNLVRSASDFTTLVSALPSLREFHCTYHKPKTGAYSAMYEALALNFPSTIAHLNLCLEGLYTKNASSLKKWRKLYPARHICRTLGAAAPQLESLTYTGRVCGALFTNAVAATEANRAACTRLKSIDIVVNNVCRDPHTHNDGTGIHNWPFIQAFEALVIQAIRSLETFDRIKSVRIRFIDLDSPAPLMNPMFHIEGNKAWGMYSDEILRALMEVRPKIVFDMPPIPENEDIHRCLITWKHRSTSLGYYKAIAHAGGLI